MSRVLLKKFNRSEIFLFDKIMILFVKFFLFLVCIVRISSYEDIKKCLKSPDTWKKVDKVIKECQEDVKLNIIQDAFQAINNGWQDDSFFEHDNHDSWDLNYGDHIHKIHDHPPSHDQNTPSHDQNSPFQDSPNHSSNHHNYPSIHDHHSPPHDHHPHNTPSHDHNSHIQESPNHSLNDDNYPSIHDQHPSIHDHYPPIRDHHLHNTPSHDHNSHFQDIPNHSSNHDNFPQIHDHLPPNHVDHSSNHDHNSKIHDHHQSIQDHHTSNQNHHSLVQNHHPDTNEQHSSLPDDQSSVHQYQSTDDHSSIPYNFPSHSPLPRDHSLPQKHEHQIELPQLKIPQHFVPSAHRNPHIATHPKGEHSKHTDSLSDNPVEHSQYIDFDDFRKKRDASDHHGWTHPSIVTYHDKRIAGCIMQCIYEKNHAVDKLGWPTLDGLVNFYSEGVNEHGYFMATLRAVDYCLKGSSAKYHVNRRSTPEKGQTCDVAFDVFDCISDRITEYCSDHHVDSKHIKL